MDFHFMKASALSLGLTIKHLQKSVFEKSDPKYFPKLLCKAINS